jgi:DNA-binding NarL/FixJ family response regulator
MLLDSKILKEMKNNTLGLFSLTPREWDVLMQSTNFLSNKEIAEALCITPESVANYKQRIKEKLDLNKGSGLLTKYVVHNLEAIKEIYSIIRDSKRLEK